MGNNAVRREAKTGALGALNAELVSNGPVNGVDLVIQGTFTGTVALQRRVNGTWYEVKTYTAAGSDQLAFAIGAETRLVMKAYTSGSADVLLCGVEAY